MKPASVSGEASRHVSSSRRDRRRYLLFVNDDPNPTEVVMGITRTVAYGSTTGPNTFVLKAIDAAGKRR